MHLIGEIVCILLGSTKHTGDFEIVVPNGYRDRARAQLVRNPHFFLEAAGCCEVIGSSSTTAITPWTFWSHPRSAILTIDGCRVLGPSLLLLYKRVLYEERFSLELSQFGFFLFSGLLGAGVSEWFCSLLRNQESKNACLPSHITLSKLALPGAE